MNKKMKKSVVKLLRFVKLVSEPGYLYWHEGEAARMAKLANKLLIEMEGEDGENEGGK